VGTVWWIRTDVICLNLQGIDKTLCRAAEIDGASGWTKTGTSPSRCYSADDLFLMITQTSSAPSRFFTTACILTTDPSVSTLGGTTALAAVLRPVLYKYAPSAIRDTGGDGLSIGYAIGTRVDLFVIMPVITLVQLRLSRRWVHYGS